MARGRCADLLEHCVEAHETFSPEPLLSEYEEKLVRKFRHAPELAAARISLLRAQFRLARRRSAVRTP